MLLNATHIPQPDKSSKAFDAKPKPEFHPSIFVQRKAEFDNDGNIELVTEIVPAAKVVVTTANESGGFDTEIIVSPEGS